MSANPSFDRNIVIAIGPAAAGKTTLLDYLQRVLESRSARVFRIKDLDILLELITLDIEGKHHVMHGPDQFEITDNIPYDDAIHVMSIRMEEASRHFDVVLGEIACGSGRQEQIDIRFAHRMGLMSPGVIQKAKFVHVLDPLENRWQRNQERVGFSHTPERVFYGLFEQDTVNGEIAIPNVELVEIANNGSREALYRQADELLTHV
jgi:hypothetical protein